MFQHYLRRQADLAARDPVMIDSEAEIVPFDASALPPVDARRAWAEARSVAAFFGHGDTASWPVPADWTTLISAYEPAAGIAFALGNSPQLVRNLHAMLSGGDLASLRPGNGRPVTSSVALVAASDYPQLVLTLGMLRLGRQFDTAQKLIEKHAAAVPEPWRALWANETAALAWHRGQAEQALKLWEAQEALVPVLFNRGMALLFTDRPTDARSLLAQAVRQLERNDDAWHHLGCLYLALADLRS
jgi:hypothetical protein